LCCKAQSLTVTHCDKRGSQFQKSFGIGFAVYITPYRVRIPEILTLPYTRIRVTRYKPTTDKPTTRNPPTDNRQLASHQPHNLTNPQAHNIQAYKPTSPTTRLDEYDKPVHEVYPDIQAKEKEKEKEKTNTWLLLSERQ
jgi:hypothetical protein